MGVGWVSDLGGIFVEDLTRFVRSPPFPAYSRTLLHERFFYLHEFHGLKLKMEEHFSFTSLLFLSAISLQKSKKVISPIHIQFIRYKSYFHKRLQTISLLEFWSSVNIDVQLVLNKN